MTKLFGGSPSVAAPPPPPPPPPPPAPMPDPEDPTLLANKRRKVAAASVRSGRASTILSDGGGETLG